MPPLPHKEFAMNKNYFKRVPTEEVLSIDKETLYAAFEEIQSDWENYLKHSGITLPKKETSKWYQLVVLKHFAGKAVHKDDIALLIRKMREKSAIDQQVRHLKTQGGWFILNRGDSIKVDGKEYYNPEGYHVLVTTERSFPHSTLQRRSAVAKGDWEEIWKQYNYTCASCGTKVGEYHRFDSAYEVLEKGHMDPNKNLEAGNIIPQCRWCNRTSRGDFTFDEQGRPRAIAGVRLVRRADDAVIDKIEKWMREKREQETKRGKLI